MTFRKRHINTITTKNRGRRNENKKQEGFLFVTLLQSILCTVMIAAAFVMSNFFGMNEIKTAYSTLATNETDAVAVFSAAKKAVNSERVIQIRQVVALIIEQVLKSHDIAPSGGMFPYDIETMSVPDGVTTAEPVISAPMKMPMEGRVTSPFGPREHPTTGRGDWHTGVDIAAAEGTAIAAAWPGAVCSIGNDDIYGNYIVIDHGGFKTRYCHCSSIAVCEGTRIRQGETVALCGSTGISTGPHLHFELLIEGGCANPIASQPRWSALETE